MPALPADAAGADSPADKWREQLLEIAALAGGMAHEIRNPLSTLNLNLQLLAEEFAQASDPRHQRALRKIEVLREECARLQKILDDFLRFVRLTGLRLEPGDLNEVMEDIADFVRPEAQRHGIIVRTLPRPGRVPCLIDRDSLRQAVLNLVINAQQAMPEGGDLIMRTAQEPQAVCLEITDTGRGMDADTLARAFRPFFTTKPGGSGLGLPMARKIVEAHGGSLTAQSEPGRGTCFTIRLPIPKTARADRDAHAQQP